MLLLFVQKYKGENISNKMSFQDVTGVIVGGIMGHSICTGIAVLGGRMIAQRISVKTGEFLLFHKSSF